jgi:signal transduction histidine kinase
MNIARTFISIIILVTVGLWIVLQGINHREQNLQVRNLERDGYQLVNFLALHNIQDFQSDRRDFVLRTLFNHHRLGQMAYLIIVDLRGNTIVNLSSDKRTPPAPINVSEEAAAAMVFIQNAYTLPSGENIVEFAKPIFSQGHKTGTVRLGLFQPQDPQLTLEKISLLATIGFYILSSAIIAYFGFSGVMRPLARLRESILPGKPPPTPARPKLVSQDEISKSLKEIQSTWSDVRKQFDEINTANRDLTTRVSVLHYENHKTEAILDHMNIGTLVTDTQNTIIQINAYLLNLFCLTREAAIDQPVDTVLVHPDTAFLVECVTGTDFSNPPEAVEVQFPEFAPGEDFLLKQALLGENHQPIGKVFTLSAITHEKTLEKTTKDFTAHLSHELLTPLTTIQSYSEMLADDEVSGTQMRKEFINTINEETTRLARLIKDILNFSKIEGGTLTLEKGLVRSDWLLKDCLSAVEGTAINKNITIEKIVPDNFPSLIGDKEQLKGCLINILGNAVKYTDDGGTIQFDISEIDDMVAFDIKDNGCGIAEEDIPLIFNKFFRSNQSAIAAQQGTGLGLAIAAEIVSMHNGTIDVQSQIGVGTLFSVKIPKEEYYLGKEDQSTSGRRRIPHQASH